MKLPEIKLPQLNIKLSPKMRRTLALSGYPLFYLFCLFLFAYWTFPYERLKERLLVELETQRGTNPNAQHVEIDSLGPYWFSGISAKGLRLITPKPPGTEGDTAPSKLSFDEAHVRVSLLPLLTSTSARWKCWATRSVVCLCPARSTVSSSGCSPIRS